MGPFSNPGPGCLVRVAFSGRWDKIPSDERKEEPMKSSRHENPKTVGLVLLLIAGWIVLGACGKKAPSEKANEKIISDMVAKVTEGKTEIDFKSGQIKVKTPAGDAVITSGGGNWPADLPEDITRFVAGSIVTSTNSQLPTGRTWTVIFRAAEAEAVAAYIEDLKSDGWSAVVSSDVPQGTFTQLQKENFFIQLTYTTDEKTLTMNVIQQKNE
jgi:hypothetical protein